MAIVHHCDAVRKLHDLIQFRGDQQHSRPFVAFLDQAVVDILDRPDIQPTRGLRCQHKLGWTGKLTGDNHLLLVSPRKRSSSSDDIRGADIKFFYQVSRAFHNWVFLNHCTLGIRWQVVRIQHQVFGDRIP